MAADSKRTSIIGRLNSTTRSIAIALLIPALVSLGMMFLTTMRYQSSMSRMARAAALKPVVGAELPEQLFSVVAGRMRYGDSGVDDLLASVNETLSPQNCPFSIQIVLPASVVSCIRARGISPLFTLSMKAVEALIIGITSRLCQNL